MYIPTVKNVNKEDLTKRAKDLKTSGDNLLKDAKDAQKDLKGTNPFGPAAIVRLASRNK